MYKICRYILFHNKPFGFSELRPDQFESLCVILQITLIHCNLCGVQAAMKDRWLNTGFHGEDLQPYTEPEHEIDDERVGKLKCTVSFSTSI